MKTLTKELWLDKPWNAKLALSMLRRLLNIASIVCLVVCVALMVLWVRSYYWYDNLHGIVFPQQAFRAYLRTNERVNT
jgi:hypothetical protein